MFSLICAWANGWASNRDADDLRRNGIHYDVTLMSQHSAYDITHEDIGKLVPDHNRGQMSQGLEHWLPKLRRYVIEISHASSSLHRAQKDQQNYFFYPRSRAGSANRRWPILKLLTYQTRTHRSLAIHAWIDLKSIYNWTKVDRKCSYRCSFMQQIHWN